MGKKILRILLALLLAVFGIVFLTDASEEVPSDPASLSEVSYTELVTGTVYYAEDLVIADSYAEMEDGSVVYFLVIFTDGSGNEVAVTMPMNKSNPLWNQAHAYLNDPTMYIGDFTVDCYVKAESNYASDSDLFRFYDEYVSDLRVGGYMLRSDSGMRLSYVCGPYEDPAEAEAGARTVGKIVGAACIVIALLILVLTFRKGKVSSQPAYQGSQIPRQVPQAPQTPVSHNPVPQTPGAGADDVMAKLQQYQQLHRSGFLTDEEYEAKRRQLLGL